MATASGSITGSRLKFFVTSRPYQEIERRFSKLSKCIPKIRVAGEKESKAISREINMVIKAKVKRIGEDLDLSKTVQSSLQNRLSEIPHRTYLWLKLVEAQIRESAGETETKLLKLIEELPTTVYKAYEKLLEKCSSKNKARKIFHIILAARRPLTLQEMDVALEVRPGSKSYDELDLEGQNIESYIRNLCGLFLTQRST